MNEQLIVLMAEKHWEYTEKMMGRFMLELVGWLSEEESRKKSENVKIAYQKKVKSNGPILTDEEKVLTCPHCGFYPVDVNGLYWSCPQCKELDDSFFEQIMVASKRVNKTDNIGDKKKRRKPTRRWRI